MFNAVYNILNLLYALTKNKIPTIYILMGLSTNSY